MDSSSKEPLIVEEVTPAPRVAEYKVFSLRTKLLAGLFFVVWLGVAAACFM